MHPVSKSNKDAENSDIMDSVAKETKSFIDKAIEDVGKSTATKQLVIGVTSGWATGFITMKVGKVAAIAVGGGIIMLQVANHMGYVKVNWDKVCKQVDKVADKVEEKATGQGPNWKDKMERFVDRKLDKAEETLAAKERKAKRWYSSAMYGERFHFQGIHIFFASFVAGLALGLVITPR